MRFPAGIQSFREIIEGDYLYVDKTAIIQRLVHDSKYYFLSRPRRFGKSLLISTLEAYFSGRHDLFKGLAIDTPDEQWTAHPIFHIDMSATDCQNEENLKMSLNCMLSTWEELYGRDEDEINLSSRFMGVLRRAYEQTGQGCVVLIDEYDKPLLEAADNEELQKKYRGIIMSFYGVIKPMDEYIHFALMTGITPLSHISVFGGLNNLRNITFNADYQAICGITGEELDTQCREAVEQMAAKNNTTYDEMREQLRYSYEGYRFVPDGTPLYNPFALLLAFSHGKIGSYWFNSGSAMYVMQLLKESKLPLSLLMGGEVMKSDMNSLENFVSNPLVTLYYAGYLTISGYNERRSLYRLDLPNNEVRRCLCRHLENEYIYHFDDWVYWFDYHSFVEDVMAGDAEGFMKRVEAFQARLSYEMAGGEVEVHFQNTMSILFMLMGLDVTVERRGSDTRSDIDVITPDYVYIFELKVDSTAREALDQINERKYALQFEPSGKKIYKIGVNFSTEHRRVTDWLIEEQ